MPHFCIHYIRQAAAAELEAQPMMPCAIHHYRFSACVASRDACRVLNAKASNSSQVCTIAAVRQGTTGGLADFDLGGPFTSTKTSSDAFCLT